MWTIRRAQAGDHDAVLRLWESLGMGKTGEEEWHAITTGSCAGLLVAEENEALLGTAVIAFDGWRAYVYHVAVTPSHRGRGLAKALMLEGEQQLRRLGATRVYAFVNESNTAGLALCAAAGYEPEGDLAFVKELAPAAASRSEGLDVATE
jgi:ribosomal protein S18 acetylase RimI-like enzyme